MSIVSFSSAQKLDFALRNIPKSIAQKYSLKEKQQNPKTLRIGQHLLGVQVSVQKDNTTIVHTYPIEILGFCDQGLFDPDIVSRPQKRLRFFATHPIEDDLICELYSRVSKYKKENPIRWNPIFEAPTMVAKLLEPSPEPFMLLQAHDTIDDGLSWRNKGEEIFWFVLEEIPQVEPKRCAECDESEVHVSFESIESDVCLDCEKKQAILQWVSPKMRDFVEYILEVEPINECKFENNELYIHVWFGGGTISEYRKKLPEGFLTKKNGSNEGMSQFGGASAYGVRTVDVFSPELGVTLYMSYDDEHGMDAQLWIEPEV